MRDVGVDAGEAGACAAVAPRHDTDEAALLRDERPARIALAARAHSQANYTPPVGVQSVGAESGCLRILGYLQRPLTGHPAIMYHSGAQEEHGMITSSRFSDIIKTNSNIMKTNIIGCFSK